MCIKDSIEPTNHGDMVKIPHQLEITWERESPIQKLIQEYDSVVRAEIPKIEEEP